jgi:hypothetical protein
VKPALEHISILEDLLAWLADPAGWAVHVETLETSSIPMMDWMENRWLSDD